jgi:hypothetical protein
MTIAQAMPATFEHVVDYSIEIHTLLQITTTVARQRAACFLLDNLGNMVTPGQPSLRLWPDRVRWKVPVLYGLPGYGLLGQIGELMIDVESGQVLLDESTPILEMEQCAEALYNAADGTPL